jgi:hypothetical protein
MEQKKCFVIGPIGKANTSIRKNADAVFNQLILPATKKFNIKPIRSDQIHEAGKLTDQMFNSLFQAHLCIVDLAGRNPNVYYELAIAQMACKPVIILIPNTEELPFDLKDFRSIEYDIKNYSAFVGKLSKFIKSYIDEDWKVDDLFSKYQLKKQPVFEPVEFDLITEMEEKTTVYKILNLKSVAGNMEKIYDKFIPRTGKKIEVYSELMATLITRFSQPVLNFSHSHRTDGDALELEGLLPFNFLMKENDFSEKIMNPVIKGPSNVFINQMHTYNGFKNGYLDLSTKAEKDVVTVNFAVDISSIPGYDMILKSTPRLFHIFTNAANNLESEELKYECLNNGIFYTTFKNLKKNEVLRFQFEAVQVS